MTRVILGVSGSAACFKGAALASLLVREGYEVRVVLSAAATELVRPLQFEAVTGQRALHDEWSPEDPSGMDHIAVARWADAMVVAPATADRIGRMALGLAGDLLSSMTLAFPPDGVRVFAPAMNPVMWSQPAVQRNAAQLVREGWHQAGPVAGPTACGEEGDGRMCEPDAVLAALRRALGQGS